MNEEIKAQWLEALRSGTRKQARNAIRNYHGFCCLGVLTDLAVEAGLGSWVMDGCETAYQPANGGKIQHDTLSPDIVTWAGLENSDPKVAVSISGKPQLASLSSMNDFHMLDFGELADLIEDQL